MALHLNLFHEIEKRKAIKRRDPLKLSLMGMGVVAFGFAAFYVYELGVQHSLESDFASRKAMYDKLQPQAKLAQEEEVKLQESVKLSEGLVKRVEGRFYFATLLDSLVQIVPREIQITRFQGEVSNDKAKKCTVTLEGLSAGAEPRKVAEDLRRALMEKFSSQYKNVTAKFNSLEDGRDYAKLDGRDLPTAQFSIGLQMQTGEDDAPAPVKRAPKKPDASAAL